MGCTKPQGKPEFAFKTFINVALELIKRPVVINGNMRYDIPI